MGVDLLRSCYNTDMRFWDNPDEPLVPVQWYFCAEGARALPFYTRFGSGNWASAREAWVGTGEVEGAARTWTDGEPPGPAPIVVMSTLPLMFETFTTPSSIGYGPFTVFKDCSLLVFIWYGNVAGPTQILSVTDNAGNVYSKVFTRVAPGGINAGLDVWRAENTADQIISYDINFVGSIQSVTSGALCVRGLTLELPEAKGAIGTGPAVPEISDFTTFQQNNLLLATFSCWNVSSITALPSPYVSAGSLLVANSLAGGAASFQALEKKRSHINTKWTATITAGATWAAGIIAFKAKDKLRLPGDHACGPESYWSSAAPADAPALGADQFGIAPCCGGPLWLGCEERDFIFLNLIITGIHSKWIGSDTVTGPFCKVNAFDGSMVEILYNPSPIFALWDPWSHVCGSAGNPWLALLPVRGGGSRPPWPSDSQRHNPRKVVFSFVPVWPIGLPFPIDERWDYVLEPIPL